MERPEDPGDGRVWVWLGDRWELRGTGYTLADEVESYDLNALVPGTAECLVCGRRVPNYARSLREHADEHRAEDD